MSLEDEIFDLSHVHPSGRAIPVILDYFRLQGTTLLEDPEIIELLKETYTYAVKHKPLERLDRDMQLRIYHIAPSLCEPCGSMILSHRSDTFLGDLSPIRPPLQ